MRVIPKTRLEVLTRRGSIKLSLRRGQNSPHKMDCCKKKSLKKILWADPRSLLKLQGISSQTVESNLALREGRKDISDILWQFFSRKHKPILISRLTFIKKKWEIMKNCIFFSFFFTKKWGLCEKISKKNFKFCQFFSYYCDFS